MTGVNNRGLGRVLTGDFEVRREGPALGDSGPGGVWVMMRKCPSRGETWKRAEGIAAMTWVGGELGIGWCSRWMKALEIVEVGISLGMLEDAGLVGRQESATRHGRG